MNILERTAYILGRSRGFLQKGLADVFSTSGARPSVNDPTAFIDQYRWGVGLEGRKPSTKGDFIDQYQMGWVYICAKLNAQTVASQRLRLYVAKKERAKEYKTIQTKAIDRTQKKWLYSRTSLDPWLTKAVELEEVTEHPFVDLMKNVNPYHNSRDLKEFTTMYSDLTGECYWLLIKNNLKVPSQIWPIPSQFIDPKFGNSLDNAIESYIYKRGSVEIELDPEDVVMFTYPNPNNIFTGFAPIQGIATEIYIQHEMNDFETAIFENRARIGGVLTQEESISPQDKERLMEQFSQKHKGSRQAGRTMWLPKGLKYTRDTMTPQEINFIEGHQLYSEITCLAFDIPPGALRTKDVNLANAQVADERHAKNGILPRCERFSEKMNEKVLPLFDEKLFCAFDDPVPQNRELLLKEQTERVKAGVMTINEVRAEEGLEPIDGGDVPYIDSRLIPMGAMPEEEQIRQFSEKVKRNVQKIFE